MDYIAILETLEKRNGLIDDPTNFVIDLCQLYGSSYVSTCLDYPQMSPVVVVLCSGTWELWR